MKPVYCGWAALCLAVILAFGGCGEDRAVDRTGSEGDAGVRRAPERASIDWSSGNVTITTRAGAEAGPPMPDRLQDAAAAAAELVDWHDTDFADTYYDPASDRVMLVPTSSRGRELAEMFVDEWSGLAATASGAVSHVELMDAGRVLIATDEFLSRHAYQLGVSRGSLGIDIHINTLSVDRGHLKRLVADLPFHVTFIAQPTSSVPGDGLD